MSLRSACLGGSVPQNNPQLAKLTRPHLYNAVARERLLAQLDRECEHRPAICITGPPGSGKTTLTASLLDTRELPGIWYQVDAGDADLASFFYHLRLGADGFAGNGRPPLPLLTPEYLPDIAGFGRRFFRELFSRLPGRATVVLDNYQEVSADHQLSRLVADAIADVREGITIVIVSRRDLPDCFARVIANERIAMLGWDELRLDLEEAKAIARARGVVDAKKVQAIYARSAGWAAGMILLLQGSRQDHKESPTTATDGAVAVAFAYFASQIFDQVIERHRVVLMRAALFPTVTADLASQISGEPDAGELLEELYRQQLFIDRRSGSPHHYQFHALFKEFLLRQLEDRESAAACKALRTRAAALLESNARTEEAVTLFRQAGDDSSAARLILTLAPRVLSQGRWRTLEEWIRALPEERPRHDPWLLYWLGVTEMQHQGFDGAREALRRAFELHAARDEPIGQLLAAAAVLRAYHFEFNNFQPMDAWIDRIDALLKGAPRFPSPQTELTVYSALLAALTQRQPAHPRLTEAVERVTDLLDTSVDVNLKVGAATPLMLYHTLAMQLDRALAVVERMQPLLSAVELTALNRAFWWALVGYYRFRCGQPEEADRALDEADRVSVEHGIAAPQFLSHIYRAYNRAILRSDLEGAVSALKGLEQYLSPARPMNAAQYHQAWYRVELLREDTEGAARHGLLGLEAASKLGAPFFSIVWKMGAATGLAMLGQHEKCEQLLAEAWSESEATFLAGFRVNLTLVRAYSALCRSNRAAAHAYIREMLALGRQNNSWRFLQPELTLREVVLEEALAADIEVELVQTIVRSFRLTPRRRDLANWPWPVKIYTLGRFALLVNDKPLAVSRKSPRRPLALLKALISLGSREVPLNKLIDAVWADEEGDAARHDFEVALYRLRKLLNDPRTIVFDDGQVGLNVGYCWIDAVQVETSFELLEQALRQADQRTISECLEAIRALYQGAFLPAERDALWSVSLRERLRNRFVQAVQRAASHFETAGRWDMALDWYGKGLIADNLAESFYQGTMRCYLQTGQWAEGLSAYRRLRECLAAELSISPNNSSEALRQQLEAR